MRKREDSGKYILENNLRTWSDLKRERLAAAAAKDKAAASASTISEKDKEKEKKLLGNGTGNGEASTTPSTVGSPVPVRKKWGGCPNGCDHGKHSYRKENSMHAMQLNGKPLEQAVPSPSSSQGVQFRRPAARRWQSSSEEDEDDPRGRVGPPERTLGVDVQKSLDEVVSSPDGTPSFISVEDRLKHRMKSPRNDLLGLVKSAGRDFGGSASGNTSHAGSDAELSAEEENRRNVIKKPTGAAQRLSAGAGHGAGGMNGDGMRKREESSMGRGAKANALGDQSDPGSDAGEAETEPELVDLEEAEKEDKSVMGSVY